MDVVNANSFGTGSVFARGVGASFLIYPHPSRPITPSTSCLFSPSPQKPQKNHKKVLTPFLKTSRRFYRPKKTAVNICELMKNHIKNYIKIMGLAAVPFGTAQATDYKIKVTQEYTCDPNDPKSEKDGTMHFDISISKNWGKPSRRRISWGG